MDPNDEAQSARDTVQTYHNEVDTYKIETLKYSEVNVPDLLRDELSNLLMFSDLDLV